MQGSASALKAVPSYIIQCRRLKTITHKIYTHNSHKMTRVNSQSRIGDLTLRGEWSEFHICQITRRSGTETTATIHNLPVINKVTKTRNFYRISWLSNFTFLRRNNAISCMCVRSFLSQNFNFLPSSGLGRNKTNGSTDRHANIPRYTAPSGRAPYKQSDGLPSGSAPHAAVSDSHCRIMRYVAHAV